MSNQNQFVTNCNIWLAYERKIKGLCWNMIYCKDIIEDVLSEAKIIYIQSNKLETFSTWYLKKTILLACRNLKYFNPKKNTQNSDSNNSELEVDSKGEENNSIRFESLDYLSESIGFDPHDEKYDYDEHEEKISELLESVEASPIFKEAVRRIEAGANLNEVAASFGVSASGLWQRLRNEGKRITESINSPQMNLIQGAEIQKKGFDQGEYKKTVQNRFSASRQPKSKSSQMELF